MNGPTELTMRGRLKWVAAAMLLGLASQYCVNFGVCALPLQTGERYASPGR